MSVIHSQFVQNTVDVSNKAVDKIAKVTGDVIHSGFVQNSIDAATNFGDWVTFWNNDEVSVVNLSSASENSEETLNVSLMSEAETVTKTEKTDYIYAF